MTEASASIDRIVRPFVYFLIAIALALAVFYLLHFVVRILLLTFAGVLFAIFLDAATQFFMRHIRLPRFPALALTVLLLIAFLAGFALLAGPSIGEQMRGLKEQLPAAIEKVASWISRIPWVEEVVTIAAEEGETLPAAPRILGHLTVAIGAVVGSLVSAAIVFVLGVYLALHPWIYINAVITLFPPHRRKRAQEILSTLGSVMRWWLVGRLVTMTTVGVLTALGLYLIGEPLAFVLGFIAGLFTFIPFVGFLLAIIPALLVALVESPTLALWVLVVFAIVEVLEGNVITPIVEHRTVSVPPAMVVLLQLLFGTLLGILGMLLATPLGVLAIVLIQMLYVEDVLGDKVKIMGKH